MSRDTKRFLIKFTAVIVAVVAILYIVLSVYRKSWNPVKWFDTPQTNIETEDPEKQSGLISPEEVEMNGIKIAAAPISPSLYDTYAVPMAAETALTLTITPTPEDADLTGAKFTIAFKNASSAWATGKSVATYVTLSQSTVKQATVSCLKAFGEPIVITYTVKGENGANKTATYQLDYRARITSFENNGIFLNGNEDYNVYLDGDTPFTYIEPTSLEATLLFSEHTIQETFTVTSCKIALSDNAKAELKKQNITPIKNEITNGAKINGAKLTWDITGLMDNFFGAAAWKTTAFRNAMNSVDYDFFSISISMSDGYSTYSSGYLHLSFDISTLPKAAQSVQFSGGSQHTF